MRLLVLVCLILVVLAVAYGIIPLPLGWMR